MTSNQYYLIHHGIKGQKWGVRRYQNEDGSLTDAGRKRYNKEQRKLAIKNEDHTILKGTKNYRITTDMNEKPGDQRLYTNVIKKDVKKYKNFYPGMIQENGRTKAAIFQKEYEFTKDVKVAGEKAYNEAFNKMFDDVRKNPKKYKDKSFDYIKNYSRQDAKEMFNKFLQLRDKKVNSEFLNRMSKKGYDVIQDRFSKKVDNTEDALIVINPKKVMKLNKTRIVTSPTGKTEYEEISGLKAGAKLAIGIGLGVAATAGLAMATGGAGMLGLPYITGMSIVGVSAIGSNNPNNKVKDINKYIDKLPKKELNKLYNRIDGIKGNEGLMKIIEERRKDDLD